MRALFIILISFFILSCQENQGDLPEIPDVPVREQINLNDVRFNALRNDNGTAYLPGGVRGIVVIRVSEGIYRAFDRNCTYQATNECAIVDVDPSGFALVDSCCGSQFSFEGVPVGGPATFPLKPYRTEVQGDILFISN